MVLTTVRLFISNHGNRYGDTSVALSMVYEVNVVCELFGWDTFMHSSRHEIEHVHHATWQELPNLDSKSLAKTAILDPVYRAVACEATVSRAWFQHCNIFPLIAFLAKFSWDLKNIA